MRTEEYVENNVIIKSKNSKRTIDDLRVGDILTIFNDKRKILGKLDLLFFLSYKNEFNLYSIAYTLDELKEHGYELYHEETNENEVEELTMDQLCKELGRTVKIKK